MAVRDFTDDSGVEWRVWSITPDQLQPRTAAEDYLGEFSEGWLCFESATERRRLANFPADWASLADSELMVLLDKATVTPGRRGSHLDGETGASPSS